MPAPYQANIDTQVPLDGRAAGSQPPMSEQDLDDLEAFLDALTDADVVNELPAAQVVPALGASRWAMLALLAAGLAGAGAVRGRRSPWRRSRFRRAAGR